MHRQVKFQIRNDYDDCSGHVATHYTLFSAFDLAAVFAGIILWTSFHWLAMCRRGGEDCFLGGIGFVLFLSLHIAFSFYRA